MILEIPEIIDKLFLHKMDKISSAIILVFEQNIKFSLICPIYLKN